MQEGTNEVKPPLEGCLDLCHKCDFYPEVYKDYQGDIYVECQVCNEGLVGVSYNDLMVAWNISQRKGKGVI